LAQPQLAFSSQRARTHVPETHRVCQFVTNDNNMIIFPHPLCSQDLAPCAFTLLNGRRFETVSNIQSKQHAILWSIKENYFHVGFEEWGKKMASLYMFQTRLL
jgi:hypothetical protein